VARAPNYRARGGQTLIDQCEAAVSEAVGQQLQPRTDHTAPWHVTVAVATSALPDLPEQWDSVKVEGLELPAAGEHPVVANFASQQGAARIPATVVLKPQVQVVMPVRAIPRNAVIRPEDVAVRHTVEADITDAARSLEEVVGRQVDLALRPDEAIPLHALRTPVVVRRREELEIIARRGGIVVRDKARAIDEGAVGDVITVERLDDAKTRLVVRVTGVRQAEVFASGTAAMPSDRSAVSTRLGPSRARASAR
jgi:flagella basal body P-ring formation protein FlgA